MTNAAEIKSQDEGAAGEPVPTGWLIKDEFDADPEAWFYTVHEDQALEYAQSGTPVFGLPSLVKFYPRDVQGLVRPDAMAGRRWRHKERGTTYTSLGFGKAQCSPSGLLDNENVVIYQGDDGSLWARRHSEFTDGRFEEVEAHPSPTPAADDDRVRIAVEALIEDCRRVGVSPDPLADQIDELLVNEAIAALKSTAAKEGGGA